MEFCQKIFKVTEHDVEDDGLELASVIIYFWDTVLNMEACCKSILQCDAQKRAELKSSLIEKDIRHCECENKFRKCLNESDIHTKVFGEDYFMKTAKCYSVDHPIIKCE